MLYPIATESRQVLSLNGIWNFKLDENQNPDGKGFAEKWFAKYLSNPINIAVPASFNDLHEGKDYRDHMGWVWYETEFTLTNNLLSSDERIVLRLDAATHWAKVYINGSLLTEHKGGYVPFEVLLNGHLLKGANRLTVAVCNLMDWSTLPAGGIKLTDTPRGKRYLYTGMPDFYNYAGLNRSVRIYTTPREHIQDIRIVTDIKGRDGVVSYEVDAGGSKQADIEILDADRNIVVKSSGLKGEIIVPHAKLWNPGEGCLYTLRVRCGEDCYEEPFGIRTVEVKGGKFLINNRPFYFKGFGKHEDAPISGRGLNEAMYIKDFSLLKWLNANSFRTSHYPYSEELMRLADKEGVVVINECAAVGLHMNFGFSVLSEKHEDSNTWEKIKTMPQHRQAMTELVKRDKNHPSVVMWSLSNESATEEKGAKEYHQELYDLTRDLDPQKRPITVVTHMMSPPDICQVADIVDVLALNRYYGWYVFNGELEDARAGLTKELKDWTKRCPNKPIMFTEYGADTVAGLHDATSVAFTEEYQKELLKMHHQVFDSFSNFVGEQIWNFADFYTTQGIMRVQGNKKGIFTRDRKPKLAAHYLKQRWAEISNFDYKK